MTESAALKVLDPGLQSSVQDRGRAHVGSMGISPSGFADWLSARIANRLVGNVQHAALIETTLNGFSFESLRPLRIAVTGAAARVTVDGRNARMWQTLTVRARTSVHIGYASEGIRSYIAFAGGIDVPSVLGSASTDLVAGFGGLEGRALASGDKLCIRTSEAEDGSLLDKERFAPAPPVWSHSVVLRALPGPHVLSLTTQELDFLQNVSFRVSAHSNRQGARLEGGRLRTAKGFDVLSTGVCFGCVQLASDGSPIILLADHQTTGGYAVPLTVISADTPHAAQLRPGDEVRFRLISHVEAALALTEKMKLLAQSLNSRHSQQTR